jgi:hypothetical protein
MDKQQRISEIQAEIAHLEAVRGTPGEPVALDAQLGQLQRTLRWHMRRLDPPHFNTGRSSLYDRNGRSKRTVRRPLPQADYPAVSL